MKWSLTTILQRTKRYLPGSFSGAQPAPTDPLQLGSHAEALLNDPVLRLALDRIDRRLSRGILDSKVGDADQREALYRLHWAKEQLLAELGDILGNAKIIAAEVKTRDAEREAQERSRAA